MRLQIQLFGLSLLFTIPTLGEVEVLWFHQFHLHIGEFGAQFTVIHDLIEEFIIQGLVPHLCVKHLELSGGVTGGGLGEWVHLE